MTRFVIEVESDINLVDVPMKVVGDRAYGHSWVDPRIRIVSVKPKKRRAERRQRITGFEIGRKLRTRSLMRAHSPKLPSDNKEVRLDPGE